MTDWTDLFDQHGVLISANKIIDDLIMEIYTKRLVIHRGMDQFELSLLYRFPLFVGVHTFIERLLRVSFSQRMNLSSTYPEIPYQPRHFENTEESVHAMYVDFGLNHYLLNHICNILNGIDVSVHETSVSHPSHKNPSIKKSRNIVSTLKNKSKKLIEFYIRKAKPRVIGEYSNWMKEILPLHNMMWFDFEKNEYPINEDVRNQIRECARLCFLKHIDSIIKTLNRDQKGSLSNLFSVYMDQILPLSTVEELTDRVNHFSKITHKWDIRQVHSFVGYYFSDNFKIFAILARRKKALLIGHAHGGTNINFSHKQGDNELAFVDIYFTWAKSDTNWLKGNRGYEHLNLINAGSTYLSTIKRWDKKRRHYDEIVLLYPTGFLMDFMTTLEEITPERARQHRIKVLELLKEVMKQYPCMKILFKPIGPYINDPINILFADELKAGSAEFISIKPSMLYDKVDIVLWDCISTGFAESIQAGVPTLLFQSQYEYHQASPPAKALIDELIKSCVLFHDAALGIESFTKVIENLPDFIQTSKGAIRRFQEAMAFPIKRKEFLRPTGRNFNLR